MRTKIRYILNIIVSLFVGAGLMFGIIYYLPNTVKIISENRNVTVDDTGIADAIEKVYDSAVLVNIETKTSKGFGSGFVYKVDKKYAYVLTNHHVVEKAKTITVEFMDNIEVAAEVVGSDQFADIAVLKIDKINGIKAAIIGDNDKMRIGDTVFTIGTPIDTGYKGTVTRGIISGQDRLVAVAVTSSYIEDYIMQVIQIDASINSGNSGGPLCNANGEVIGMNTMKISSITTENIGFAIPIEDAVKYAEDLLQNGEIQRPYVGLGMYDLASAKHYSGLKIDVDDDIEGIYIEQVNEDSPASKAGLKKGDILTKIGEYNISSVSEFRYYLYKFKVNDEVELKIIRNKKTQTIKIKLGKSE